MTPAEMREAELIRRHDAAYEKAKGCPVYAPKQGTDEGVALHHATRSGGTSARASEEWMRLYREMKRAGLRSLVHPHLFPTAHYQAELPPDPAPAIDAETLAKVRSALRELPDLLDQAENDAEWIYAERGLYRPETDVVIDRINRVRAALAALDRQGGE